MWLITTIGYTGPQLNFGLVARKAMTEDGIKQEFEQTLSSRVERYLKIKPHGIIPFTEFAPVSAECAFLFRDGHFYGAIAVGKTGRLPPLESDDRNRSPEA